MAEDDARRESQKSAKGSRQSISELRSSVSAAVGSSVLTNPRASLTGVQAPASPSKSARVQVHKPWEDAAGPAMSNMVSEKDVQLLKVHRRNEEQYDELAEDTARISNALRVQRAACFHLSENINARLKEMKDNVSAEILEERHGRHAVETKLERLVDEKVSEVGGHLAEDAELQKESSRYTKEMSDEICRLYTDIEQARKYRAEKCNNLLGGVKQKFGEIKEAIAAEHEMRLESESTLLELFGQMGQRMELELESSRKERHIATDRLIALMEAVLPKLDNSGNAPITEEIHETGEAKDMAGQAAENARRRRQSVSQSKRSLGLKAAIAPN